MARTKYQKLKSGKQTKHHQNRKHNGGKENDVSELRAQLDVLGLKIIQVTADGNCFFRALADQLEGDEDEYEKYRHMIVQFIKENREIFEPFVEDETFDEYCRSMAEDGTWAGNIELQAASLVTRSNICIHRLFCIFIGSNMDGSHSFSSYHDGEHYNSVRTKEDTCSGPARSIVIKGEAKMTVKSSQQKAASTNNEAESASDSIDLMEDGAGYKSMEIEQGDDVDSAAEDYSSHSTKSSCDDSQVEKSEQASLQDQVSTHDGDSGLAAVRTDKKKSFPKKNIPRNKNCPCGSKMKYKSCCGKSNSKASVGFPINPTIDSEKSHKDSKHWRRADGKTLDMGALCI